MALTVSSLTTSREAIIAAMASGTRRVQLGDKVVEYNSISDMLKAIAFIDGQIQAIEDGGTGVGVSTGTVRRLITGEGL